jgi:hypothetical protein
VTDATRSTIIHLRCVWCDVCSTGFWRRCRQQSTLGQSSYKIRSCHSLWIIIWPTYATVTSSLF